MQGITLEDDLVVEIIEKLTVLTTFTASFLSGFTSIAFLVFGYDRKVAEI